MIAQSMAARRTAGSLKKMLQKRLYDAMRAKGIRPADLVRATPGLKKSALSSYMRGVSLPMAEPLEAIEKSLGMAPGTLLPGYDPTYRYEDMAETVLASAESPKEPVVMLTPVSGGPGRSRVRLDIELPNKIALQIYELAQSAK